MNDRHYLLTIELLDIEPTIWRQFVVPSSITLVRLHDVIQIVMGWHDQNSWQQLEQYISDHSEALFSHGMCPHCAEKQMKTIGH